MEEFFMNPAVLNKIYIPGFVVLFLMIIAKTSWNFFIKRQQNQDKKEEKREENYVNIIHNDLGHLIRILEKHSIDTNHAHGKVKDEHQELKNDLRKTFEDLRSRLEGLEKILMKIDFSKQ